MARLPTVLLALALILTWQEPARACSCADGSTFVQTAVRSTLVVHGRVVAHRQRATLWESAWRSVVGLFLGDPPAPLYLEVEVIEAFRGKPNGRRVAVWTTKQSCDDDGAGSFRVGTEWVLAVDRGTGDTPGWGYDLSGCGDGHSLRVKGSRAFGLAVTRSYRGEPTLEAVPLERLRTLLRP